MDNITHSLIGAALAGFATRARAPKAERRLTHGAGIIAANLPDIDLIFAPLTPAPLGYLLHHRGHTHTIPGLVVLAVILVAVYGLLPPIRRLGIGDRARFWGVIGVGLASHVALDALNSYGVHPFHPFDSTWLYGDAVFVFEPSIWMVLGIAALWNAQTRAARLAATLPILLFLVAMAWLRIIPPEAAVLLVAAGTPLVWISGKMPAAGRAALALSLTLAIISGFVWTSRTARLAAAHALRPSPNGELVDLILSPNPASPLCWMAIAVELDLERGEYVLRRGTLSLAPRWKKPIGCASHRLLAAARTSTLDDRPSTMDAGRSSMDDSFVLQDEIRQPLARLRQRAASDCWTKAWLRFGRAPVIEDGANGDLAIFDLRFADRERPNFTRMTLDRNGARAGCPPYVPSWRMPRQDLLTSR